MNAWPVLVSGALGAKLAGASHDLGAMVSDEASNIPSPFDVRTIKYLVRLMSQHDLSEIDLREADLRIRLRRGGKPVVSGPAAGLSAPSVPVAAAQADAAAPPAEKPARPVHLITSPTPGTFYTASGPDAPAFVQVGSRVTPATVVCIIEAMKIFNEITAECSGVVTKVCVENQQAVEWGQALFEVDPAG